MTLLLLSLCMVSYLVVRYLSFWFIVRVAFAIFLSTSLLWIMSAHLGAFLSRRMSGLLLSSLIASFPYLLPSTLLSLTFCSSEFALALMVPSLMHGSNFIFDFFFITCLGSALGLIVGGIVWRFAVCNHSVYDD